jgi:hypothetical protein
VKPRDALLRGLVATCALLVAAWLALGLRSTILDERGRDGFTKGLALGNGLSLTEPTPAQVPPLTRAAHDLDRAAWLNPDGLPRAYRAQVLVLLGQGGRARTLIGQVTQDEPDNAEIWRAARGVGIALRDRGLELRAKRRIRELQPPDSP